MGIDTSELLTFPLFAGIPKHDLEELATHSKYSEPYKLAEHIAVDQGKPAEIMLVNSGCVAVQSNSFYSKSDQILALIMPKQVILEFEYLGNRPPVGLKLFCLAPTSLIFVPTAEIDKLVQKNATIMKNIALSVVEKTNIDNFRADSASQHQGDRKIACLLSGFNRFSEWKPSDYRDRTFRDPMKIPVIWSVNFLKKFFCCDERTIWKGLLDLLNKKIIKIDRIDVPEDLTQLTEISAADIEVIVNKGNIDKEKPKTKQKTKPKLEAKLKQESYFYITELRPSGLNAYVEP